MKCKFPFNWTLKNCIFTKDRGTVFSCFACGGGSTMGYKLAGFDVIGCNEIDPKINEVYIENHHPRLNFNCDIRELVTKAKEKTLPNELYNLDILDGSPPCSTFSIAGNRERDWGKEKKFREGQSKQILDTLFFDFIELAKELKPKVVVAENVKGILLGNAIDYVRRIYKDFEDAGYYCNHFLLDASKMGVPQKRERVFFVCIRHDLGLNFLKVSGLFNVEPYINMTFTEIPILMNEIADFEGREIKSATMRKLWENRIYGDIDQSDANVRLYGKKSNFNQQYVYLEKVCYTLASKESCLLHMNQPKMLSKSEVCKISTFPSDYNFYNVSPHYICGMSVPPVMMAQIAQRIWEYWLSKLQTTKE